MPTYKKCKTCDTNIAINAILCDECLMDSSIAMTLRHAAFIFKLRIYDIYYSNLTTIEHNYKNGMFYSDTYYLVDELIELADKRTKRFDPGHIKRKYFTQQKDKYQKLKENREERLNRKRRILENVEAAFNKYDAPFTLDNYGIKLIINKYVDNENLTSMEATYGIVSEIDTIINKKKKEYVDNSKGMLGSLFD